MTTWSSRSRCASCWRACARCCAGPARRTSEGRALEFEDLRLDRRAHEAWRGERLLPLTRTEFLLLEMFLRHPRQVLTRSAIFEHVWGYDFGSTSNSLGVYMGYLRRKTEVGDRAAAAAHRARRRLRAARAPMSFRRRITLASAAAVAVAVVLASRAHLRAHLQPAAQPGRLAAAQPRPTAVAAARYLERHSPCTRGRGARLPSHAASRPRARRRERAGREQRLDDAALLRPNLLFGNLPPRPGQVRGYQQLVDAERARPVPLPGRASRCPSTPRTRALAPATAGSLFSATRA